ncbi:urod, partial [Symbiodinium microadriaticum]
MSTALRTCCHPQLLSTVGYCVEASGILATETLSYVFDAIYWTRDQVQNKVPVIGFSGAPWTLMGYMVEGGAVRSFDRAKKWLYLYPEASRRLLTALRDVVVEYLVGQFDSGAPLLTVFDTNCGEVPPRIYEEFCVPDLKYIATE